MAKVLAYASASVPSSSRIRMILFRPAPLISVGRMWPQDPAGDAGWGAGLENDAALASTMPCLRSDVQLVGHEVARPLLPHFGDARNSELLSLSQPGNLHGRYDTNMRRHCGRHSCRRRRR
jgi:hypothetical protein